MNRGRVFSPARIGMLATVALLVTAGGASGAQSSKVTVYFLRGEQFATVVRPVLAGQKPELVALGTLLAGPTAFEQKSGFDTAIPRSSRLLSVQITRAKATVNVHFGATKNDPLSASLRPARTAQLAATLRSLPGIKTVLLFVDGLPIPAPNTTGPDSRPPADPDLQPDTGAPADVLGLQTRLAELKYLAKDAVSGVWDYRSEHAVMAFQSWQGLDRDGDPGPKTLAALGAAPVPTPTLKGSGRWIEVYRGRGITLLVRNGKVVRAIHNSSGGPGHETPNGDYRIVRKERYSWSVPYRVWLPYASYFTGGIAFHAFFPVPTYPASHGCVRTPYPEAADVYAYATLGTRVLVYA